MGVLRIAEGVLSRARRVSDDADVLVTGRAGLLGLASAGRVSAGGATRLLRTGDGWCALTLSRPDDVDAVPALLERDSAAADPWPEIERWAAGRSAAAVVERARLLDLPAAVLGETTAAPPRVQLIGDRTEPRDPAGLLVADLTSMWAGPLCGQLLVRAGATVIKVESPMRPDGTRSGERRFFDWMNAGKLGYCLDFDREAAALAALLDAADIVLEGSRPAGLIRRSLGPHDRTARPGRIWLRFSGYGGTAADRVAFGDDAAVAGNLVCSDWSGDPEFMADALADPLTGLESYAALRDSLARGGGELIEVAMAAVAADYAARADGNCITVTPAAVTIETVAPELGADNPVVHRIISERDTATC